MTEKKTRDHSFRGRRKYRTLTLEKVFITPQPDLRQISSQKNRMSANVPAVAMVQQHHPNPRSS
jgi:hypothetical protein